jgi:hypothetical protein
MQSVDLERHLLRDKGGVPETGREQWHGRRRPVRRRSRRLACACNDVVFPDRVRMIIVGGK